MRRRRKKWRRTSKNPKLHKNVKVYLRRMRRYIYSDDTGLALDCLSKAEALIGSHDNRFRAKRKARNRRKKKRNPILLINPPRRRRKKGKRSRRNPGLLFAAGAAAVGYAAGKYWKRGGRNPPLSGGRPISGSMKGSKGYQQAARLYKERYGVWPDKAIPVDAPRGSGQYLAGIGPEVESKYMARDHAGEAKPTEWYHPAGDNGEGKRKSRASWYAADPTQDGRVLFVDPPGAKKRFRRDGIHG